MLLLLDIIVTLALTLAVGRAAYGYGQRKARLAVLTGIQEQVDALDSPFYTDGALAKALLAHPTESETIRLSYKLGYATACLDTIDAEC